MTERSYNGWVASRDPDAIGIVPFRVAGESFTPGVRGGHVETVFRYLCEQFHSRVEPLVRDAWHQADDWGYYFRQNRNADNLSCHSSGTAVDVNATRHPNGQRGTFTAAQVREIRQILAELDGVVGWGGDFTGTPDEMHFEIRGTAAQVAAVARRLTTPTSQEDDMTPEQDARLKRIEAFLDALTAKRLPDKSDADPGRLSLADIYTQDEKEHQG